MVRPNATTAGRWLPSRWRHPSAVLLVVQVLGILVYPFFSDRSFMRAVIETAAVLILAVVVNSLGGARWVVWSTVALGLVAGTLTFIDTVSPDRVLVITSGLLHAFLYFVTAGSLLRYMFRDQRVTRDELFAIGATFTVLAWAYAYVHVSVAAIQASAYSPSLAGGERHTWVEMLFFSVTALTNTGLSDITPVSGHARSVVMLEQITGLGYVALVVSTVVGLTLRRQRHDDE